jgi:pimeloyl-ACP methyl ester carboxylesterase
MKKMSRKGKVTMVFLAFVAFLILSYVYALDVGKEITDTDRKHLPGQVIGLSQGVVYYEMNGPSTGKTVVLIHGLTTPSFVWDKNMDALVEAGFRVLRYDLYGRGFSDRPRAVYDRDLFDKQLLDFIKVLGPKEPVHLVGFSMGGAVAVTFTERHPEMVSRLCLISPAGFLMREGLGAKLVKVPILGDYIFALFGNRVLLSRLSKVFVQPEKFPEFREKFETQLRYKGYKHAVLSTLRHMDMHGLAETYQRVGKLGKRVLMIWGREDQVIPFENGEMVKKAIPHVIFNPIHEAGHVSIYEKPESINPLLTQFLR